MLTYNKITLSGVAGTGKSTVGKILKEKLGYEFVSVGNFARDYAEKEFGLTINAFQEKCRLDPSLDEMIDRKFKAYCNERSGIIADYRLGFKFIENAFHCLLTVSDSVAATRIQQGQRQGEAVDITSIQKRNQEMRNRFIEKYGVDFTDTKNYQLVIHTDALPPHAVADLIVQAFSHA